MGIQHLYFKLRKTTKVVEIFENRKQVYAIVLQCAKKVLDSFIVHETKQTDSTRRATMPEASRKRKKKGFPQPPKTWHM
jgi:hypothetical protein